MAVMTPEAFQLLATSLREQVADLSHNDLYRWLSDACQEAGAYLIDFIGDNETGDVIASKDGCLFRYPYEIQQVAGTAKATVDISNSEEVLPHTVYEPKASEESIVEAALKERIIHQDDGWYLLSKDGSKKLGGPYKSRGQAVKRERQVQFFKHQHEAEIPEHLREAAKGIQFVIGYPKDGSGGEVQTVIFSKQNWNMAGAKKWLKAHKMEVPEVDDTENSYRFRQNDPSKYARMRTITPGQKEATIPPIGELKLNESAETLEPIVLREARADYQIRLIAPGKGASAFYPREVLQRDGPTVFKAGTHVYLNHPTATEEAARPEGDVKNLAGVLTENAHWEDAHPKGPGLFARMKVFADHAQLVEEKAPHVGMSIRATGTTTGKMIEGLPELKALTAAESVDVVTRAGAGGMILTEAARAAQSNEKEGGAMDAAEALRLQEAERRLTEVTQRLARSEAREVATSKLATIRLLEETRLLILERAVSQAPVTDKGDLDKPKFEALLEAEIKYAGTLLGGARVTGVGATPDVPPDPKKTQESIDGALGSLARSMGLSEAATKTFVAGRVN